MASRKRTIALEGFTPEESANLSRKIKFLKSSVTISTKILKGFTHLVCDRIISSDKFFVACAQGAWIVNPQFVEDSFSVGKWLSEQDYVHSVTDKHESEELVAASQRWRWRWQMFKEHPYTGWTVAVLVEGEERLKYIKILSLGGANVVPLLLPLADNQNVADLTFVFMDESNAKSVHHLQEFGLICVQLSFITDTILKDEDLDPFQYLMQAPRATDPEDEASGTASNAFELTESFLPASENIDLDDENLTVDAKYNKYPSQDSLKSSQATGSDIFSRLITDSHVSQKDRESTIVLSLPQLSVGTVKEIEASEHTFSSQYLPLCSDQLNQNDNSISSIKPKVSINTQRQTNSKLQIQPMDPNRPVDYQQKESRDIFIEEMKKKRELYDIGGAHCNPQQKRRKLVEEILLKGDICQNGRTLKSTKSKIAITNLPPLSKSIYTNGKSGTVLQDQHSAAIFPGKSCNDTAASNEIKTPSKSSRLLVKQSASPLSASIHLYGIHKGETNDHAGSRISECPHTETVSQTAQTPGKNGVRKNFPCFQALNPQSSPLASTKAECGHSSCDSSLETKNSHTPSEKSASLSQSSASPLRKVQSSLQSFGFFSSFEKGQRSTSKKFRTQKPSSQESPSTTRNLMNKLTPSTSPSMELFKAKQEPQPDPEPIPSPVLPLMSTNSGNSCDTPIIISSSDDEDTHKPTLPSDDEEVLLGDSDTNVSLCSDDEEILLSESPRMPMSSISMEPDQESSSLKSVQEINLFTQHENNSETEKYHSSSENLGRISEAKISTLVSSFSTPSVGAHNVRKSLFTEFDSVAKNEQTKSLSNSHYTPDKHPLKHTLKNVSARVSNHTAFSHEHGSSNLLNDSLPSPEKVEIKGVKSEDFTYEYSSGSNKEVTCNQKSIGLSNDKVDSCTLTSTKPPSSLSSVKKKVFNSFKLEPHEPKNVDRNYMADEPRIDTLSTIKCDDNISKQSQINEESSEVNMTGQNVMKPNSVTLSNKFSPLSEDSSSTYPEKDSSRPEAEHCEQKQKVKECVPVLYGQWMEAAQELGLYDSAISHGRPTQYLLPTSLVLSQLVSLAGEVDSGEENVSSQAVAYLHGWLHLHPPTNVTSAKIYAAALKIDIKDHNYLMDWIKNCTLVPEGCSDTAHLQGLLQYFVSVLDQNFKSCQKIADKKLLQNSMVVSWLWENPLGVFHTSRTCQVVKLLERFLLSSSSKQIDLVTCEAVCSLIGLAAECIRLASNGWYQQKQWFRSDAVMVIVQDIARTIYTYMNKNGSEVIVILNFFKAPWLRAAVTAQILSSNFNCYLLSDVIEVSSLSLHSIVSQYFFLVPKLSAATECPSRYRTKSDGLRDEGNEKPSTIRNQRAADRSTNMPWNRRQKTAVLEKRNHKGETALHIACIKNNYLHLKQLLSHPDVNVNVRDAIGWTPLHEACNHGSLECVELLLQYVPQVEDSRAEIYDTKGDIVDSEVEWTSKSILKKADLNARGPDDLTPFHDAVWNNHISVSRLLLQYGGQRLLKAKTALGNTAFNLVQSPEMYQLLKSFSLDSKGSAHNEVKCEGYNHNNSQTDQNLLLLEQEERAPLSALYAVIVGDKAKESVSFDNFSHFLSLLSTLFTAYCEARNHKSFELNKQTSVASESSTRGHESSSMEISDKTVLSQLLPLHLKLLKRHVKKLTKEEDFGSLKPHLKVFKAICYSAAV